MKKFFKWLGMFFGVIVLLIAGLVVNVTWFKPVSINIFFETAFLKYALESPEMLSSIRMLEQIGLNFHNDDLADISPAHTEKLNQWMVEDREMLHRYDRSKLEGQAAISYDVMDWLMTDQTEGVEFTWHGYPVNQLFGVQNGMPRFMATIHHVGNERDARHYNTRLSKFDT
ncbi:MAG: DUF885 family protein, partial [Gammaproteobacteria bacterium]|nr:DUF885 family protein [Gammaproteobacteria bacterium]